MKKTFIIILFSFFSIFSFSQTDTIKNCLLWEISGNGLTEKSYIFGTVHLIPKDDFFFYDTWIEAFDQCNNLILETDLKIGVFKQLSLLKKMKLPNDSLLSDYMTNDEYRAYKSFMLDSLNITPSKYNLSLNYKPFFTYSLLLDDVIPGEKIIYEQYFSDLADKKKMKIIGLETIDYQISLIEAISVKDQIPMFLFDYNKTVQTDFENEFKKLLILYIDQNLNEISTFDQDENNDYFNQNFLVKRNTNWIPLIEEYIKEKPSFIAVGAAHLPGEQGVLKLLKDKGYTLSPVCTNLN